MPYEIQQGSQILLNHLGGYIPPHGDVIYLPVYSGPPVEESGQKETPWFDVPWGELNHRDGKKSAGWKPKRTINRRICSYWAAIITKNSATKSAWKETDAIDKTRRVSFQEFSNHYGKSIENGWLFLRGKDKNNQRISWGNQYCFDHGFSIFYLHPPRAYNLVSFLFEKPNSINTNAFYFPWFNPPAKDRSHETVWGKQYYKEICERKYEPPNGAAIVLNNDKPISQVGDKDHIDFWFDQLTYDRRCKWREPSGWRDAYFYRPPKPIPSAEKKRFYYMLNTALLTRVSDGKPIDAKSINLTTNIDSWCWTMSAGLASREDLETAFPGVISEIAANINGHEFVLQAERYSKGELFASKGLNRSIHCRSLSANLAHPFGPLISMAEGVDRTAEQLAQGVLDQAALAGAGEWTINWGDFVDWLVPGEVWSVAERTPIEIIQEIVRAGAGFIQTHQKTKTILVKPRYRAMPWLWGGLTPDIIIPAAMIISMDGENEPKLQYNSAFVSGTTTGGISAKVTRAGTAGDISPAIFTSPLMTDTDAALAKGSAMIAESGWWETIRFTIQLSRFGSNPGLILPGTMVRIEPSAGQSIMCQTIGTSINVNAARSGGVIIRQILEAERYHGA